MAADARLELPPLGLYVHLPWCVRKCPYCDFNSHTLHGDLPTAAYTDALIRDLENDLPRVWGRTVSSVFFGGGTPSLFPAASIDVLLAAFRARLPTAPHAEITLEANPGTVEYDHFAAYREAGVNRVSLGVQSFDDNLLKAIGRIHGRSEIEAALESLHAAGMENFNVDLMYGLPGQSVDQAVADVERAIAAGPAHISHYQLTLEPNTAFAVQPPVLPDDEQCWEMQQACADRLSAGGFQNYEISAWARPGRQCRHNLNYWRYGDFLGIGAGAHAKLTDQGTEQIRRLVKTRHPRHYLATQAVAEDRCLDPAERVFEYFLNVLRLSEPFTTRQFSNRTGLPWSEAAGRIGHAIELDMLEPVPDGFRVTESGRRFCNDLQALFLP